MASATSAPATKVQSAAHLEYGYPNGHIGHLTEDEEETFKKFKEFLAEKDYYKPGPPPSHDDPTLLRFLRARKWDIQEAFGQFKDTEDWRNANHVRQLYETIDLEAYDQSRRLYPQWTGRRDRRGIPLYLFEIRHLDSKTVSNYEKTAKDVYSKAPADGNTPPTLLRLFALYENLTRFVQPLCAQLTDRDHPETPITLSTNIVDVSGVSLRQFWNLKSHMQAASQLATAHYPETLDRIFVIGAPVFFSTVWGWIKRWFDPLTVSKIFILSAAEVKPTLEAFIAPENIPAQYGGKLAFRWGDQPVRDPAIEALVRWEEGHDGFPAGPVYWREIEGGARLECVAVGSVERKDRLERVCTIPKAFPGREEGHVKAEGGEETEEQQPVVTTGVEASNAEVVSGVDVPSVTTGVESGTTAPASAPGTTSGDSATSPPDAKDSPELTPSATPASSVDKEEDKPAAGDSTDVSGVQGIQNLSIQDVKKAET